MKINWNFQGVEEVQNKKPSMGGGGVSMNIFWKYAIQLNKVGDSSVQVNIKLLLLSHERTDYYCPRMGCLFFLGSPSISPSLPNSHCYPFIHLGSERQSGVKGPRTYFSCDDKEVEFHFRSRQSAREKRQFLSKTKKS